MSDRSQFEDEQLFEYELFISYAHIDNATPPGVDQEGWVSYFHKSLEYRVPQLYGKKLRIWRDEKLDGNDIFDDEILDQLPTVKFLVTVLSPRYVESVWCLREFDAFCRAAQQNLGISVQNKSRIFKVIKTPIDIEQHPGVLGKLLGYEFYKRDPETDRLIEFDRNNNPNADKDFWPILNDLAEDITKMLKRLEHLEPPDQNGHARPGKKYIYLAETGTDLKEDRAGIRRELASQDYLVLPDRRLTLAMPEYQQEVEQMLTRCAFSVHMIGQYPGVVPDGAEQSVIALQNELAAARSAVSDFKRLIWLPPALDVKSKQHQRFIEMLHRDKAALTGADLLETPLDAFKVELQHLLAESKKKDDRDDDEDDDALTRIYLLHDKRDREAVVALDDYLYEQGFEVIVPSFEGEVETVFQDHEENLRFSDAVLIYFGAANDLWLKAKLRETSKIAGQGRARKFLAKYVYVTGPKTPEKERYRTREAEVIKHFDSFTPESLARFVDECKKKRERPHDR